MVLFNNYSQYIENKNQNLNQLTLFKKLRKKLFNDDLFKDSYKFITLTNGEKVKYRVDDKDQYSLDAYENNSNTGIHGYLYLKDEDYKTFITFDASSVDFKDYKSLLNFLNSKEFIDILKRIYDENNKHLSKIVIYPDEKIIQVFSYFPISENPIDSKNEKSSNAKRQSLLHVTYFEKNKHKFTSNHSVVINCHNPKAKKHLLVMPKKDYVFFLDFIKSATYEEKLDFFKLTVKTIRKEINKNSIMFLMFNIGELFSSQDHCHLNLIAGKERGKFFLELLNNFLNQSSSK
jgi:diadenosine tetraphosphate (Ap4A) HIT family hydrolase